MKEVFKDISGYEGKYQVSNLGHVKSLNYNGTGKEKILQSTDNGYGYYRIHLFKNGKVKSYYLHRLVAQAFIKNPENLPEVNHINQNKKDNRVDNLEWVSSKYNVRYSKAKKVGCYKDGKLIKVYDAIKDVEQDGFHVSHVCICCKDNRKSHGGYQWKYLD